MSSPRPAASSALAQRKKNLSQPMMQAVELAINVRNKVVHPPNNIRSVEWPSGNELFEAWQLTTWCLELSILRLLGYPGELHVASTAPWLVWANRTGPMDLAD